MLGHKATLVVLLQVFCVYKVMANERNDYLGDVVKKTLRYTARSCMDSVNATETDLEYLRGDPPFPEKSSCIITCLFEKVGVVKHDKYSKAGFMAAVTPIVLANKKKVAHMRSVSENCEKEIKKGLAHCQLGNEIIICIYKYAPELHFKAK